MGIIAAGNSESEKLNNIIAFWAMATTQLSIRSGLSTAAHDLLSVATTRPKNLLHSIVKPPATECNSTSTGSIVAVCYVFNLIAAMLIIIFCYETSPLMKLVLMETFFIGGFVIITFSDALWTLFCGVIVIGIAISIFELTIPPLATTYKVQATNALAAGAGMAQTLGSTVYVSMKAINVSENEPFYPFIIINLVGLLVFVVLLTPPEKDDNIEDIWSMDQELEIVPLIVGSGAIEKPQSQPTNTSSIPKSRKRNMHLSLCKKADMFANNTSLADDICEAVRSLADILIYLVLFYFLEYYTNLGLLEHATVRNFHLSTSEQYRWYMFAYHITQTICRSIPLPDCLESKLGIITLGQAVITAVVFSHALFDYIPRIEIMTMVVILEGILGSVAYLIGLRHARSCSAKESVKKAATIMVLSADVMALGLGSMMALITHGTFCHRRMQNIIKSVKKHSHVSYVQGHH